MRCTTRHPFSRLRIGGRRLTAFAESKAFHGEEPTLTAKSEVSRRGWRRIAAYFFAGLMFSLACSWASFNWDTFERAYTARFGEDPYLVQHGDEILSWFPWGACAVIIALLGPPHEKGYPGGAIDCDLHYHLGPERGWMRIDSEWLFIALGNDGRVKRTWLYRD